MTTDRGPMLVAILLGIIALLHGSIAYSQDIGIVSPTDGSTLSGSSVTLTWTADGQPVSKWRLEVGTSPGSTDILLQGISASTTSYQVSGLPTDGSLVYITLKWKVPGSGGSASYSYATGGGGGNTPPSATITTPADSTSFDPSDVIAFVGTASDVEDGTLSSSLGWSSSIDGALGSGASINTALSEGTHLITASVTDSGGLSDSDAISITIAASGGNTAPSATVTAPSGGSTFGPGDVIAFVGDADDAEDGSLSSSISWNSSLDGNLGSGETVNTSLSDGTHIITASVTDSGGLSASDVISVVVSGGGGSGVPAMIAPSPGSILAGDTETFSWSANGATVTKWRLEVGSSPGGTDIFLQGISSTVTSAVVDNLPTDGSLVYVRLKWKSPDGNQRADYTYVSGNGGGANSAPTFTSQPATSASVAVAYSYDSEATDPDAGDMLTYTLDDAPAGMTIDPVSGLLQWTPMSGDEGTNSVVVRVSDDGSPTESATQAFNVIVGPAGVDSSDLLYFSTEGDVAVSGVPAPYDDGDIYRYDPADGSYTRVFDVRDAGLKPTADIDALHVVDPVTFYLSFSDTGGTEVPGLGFAMDEDVVLYSAGVFSWVFKGTDVSLGDDGDAENVDGIHVLSDGSILVSTSGTPVIAGLTNLGEEDILRCDGTFGANATCNWSVYFDGSDAGLGSTSAENVNALFELDDDIYFSTEGDFDVAGLSGNDNDIVRCEANAGGAPVSCSSFSLLINGDASSMPGNIDAAHFVPDALADPDPQQFRVVVLGSSTAEGTGASSPANSWAGRFDAWLGTVNGNHQVVNLALSGADTEVFRPLNATSSPDPNRNIDRALELNPDMVIINLPSRNVVVGIPIPTTIAHYNEIKAETDAAGIPFFLTTTQPKSYEDLSLRLLLQDEAIAVRTEFGANVIDIYDDLVDVNNDLGLKVEYDSGDGSHLNDDGHEVIFTTARDLLAPSVPP